MPDRIIKESICTSDTIDKLSWFEEVFWHRLTVNCDDYGRFDGRPAILKSRLFPLKSGVTDKNILETLNRLSTVGLVILYTYEDRPYLQLVTWEKHQRVRAQKSKYPSPADGCRQPHAETRECPRNPIQSESNPNPIQSESANAPRPRFKKPTVDEVREYCDAQGYSISPEHFVDYYESNGWRVGKNSMKDWKATVRTWEQREKGGNARAKPSTTTTAAPEKQYGTIL